MKKSKEDLIKEELLNKEIEWLELDNYFQGLGATNSIYEGDLERLVKDQNFAYWFEDEEILIHFEFINVHLDVEITKIETL